MLFLSIKQFIIQNPKNAVFAVVGLFFLYGARVIKNKIYAGFIKEKLVEKHTKTIAANLILLELNTNSEKLQRLLKEKEVVGVFDVEDSYEVLKHLKSLENAHKRSTVLNNKGFADDLSNLINNVYLVIMDIVNLENQSYEKMRTYEEKKVFYNREFEKLNKAFLTKEKVKVIKKNISAELAIYNEDLNKLNKAYNKERDELYQKLVSIKTVNDLLIRELIQIKEKEIDAKKFYFSRLSYL